MKRRTRNRRLASTMLVAAGVLFVSSAGHGQTPSFSELDARVGTLQRSHSELEFALRGIRRDLGSLRRASGGERVPPEYAEDLVWAARVLRSSDPDMAALANVRLDLSAKARATESASGGVAYRVDVDVRTVRGGSEVAGYAARCNPIRDRDNRRARYVFNRPTPTETRQLPPGNYWCWAEDSRQRRVAEEQKVVVQDPERLVLTLRD